jgi:hypothetical protein
MEMSKPMSIDRRKLYDKATDYFDLDGNAIMKLSREAAEGVCLAAAAKGFVLVKVEGGIWSDGNFEARLDAIWDGLDPPIDQADAHENNLDAAGFIRSRADSYNAFIVTTPSITGYGPRQTENLSSGAARELVDKA